MENHIQTLAQLLKDYNLSASEKQTLKDYLKESMAREILEELDKEPHWEELDYTLKGDTDKFFNEIVDITISYKYSTTDIIELDNAIIALL